MASWASSIVPDLAGAILRGQLGNAGAALKASDWQGLSGRRDPNNMFRLSPQWPVPLNMRNIQRLAYAVPLLCVIPGGIQIHSNPIQPGLGGKTGLR